jgi:hypothetical protein
MSKVKIVSFSTTKEDKGFLNFYPHLVRLYRSAKKFGYNDFSFWNRGKIKNSDFYKENQEILDQKRGAGYWLWKPYIILEELKKIEYGDFIVYLDSAYYFLNNIEELINLSHKNNGFFFDEIKDDDKTCKFWTKRDCFILMDCDEDLYYNYSTVQSGLLILEKNEKVISFIKEWLRYSQDKRILTDINNTLGKQNFNEFIEHRHDQAILSLLRIKYNIDGFRNPSQWGLVSIVYKGIKTSYNEAYRNSPYKQVLHHDKSVNLKGRIFSYFTNSYKLFKDV